MHNTTTRTPRSGTWTARLAVTGAAGLVLAVLPSGVAAAHGGWGRDDVVHHVEPGQSIQAAVDQARSGDTIVLAPGTYTEAVCIEGKGLTIEGAGREETTIAWPEWESVEDLPAVAQSRCWTEQERVDGEDVEIAGDPGASLADNVSALFFLEPDAPVEVRGLQTRNHPASGILAWGGDGFTVEGTKGSAHDRYGILAVDTTDVAIRGNVEVGRDRGTETTPDSGTAGISVGDVEAADAHIAGNHVEGYNLGIFLREASGGGVSGNSLTGNCIGLLVFDDVATEVPDATRDVAAGEFWISGNEATANDRYCLQGRDADQHVSGVGMQVVNADDVTISGNSIRDNAPTLPGSVPMLTNPAGGLTVFTLPPFNLQPGQVPAGPVEDVRVVGNHFGDNRAAFPVPGAGLQSVQMDVFVGDDAIPPLLDPGPGLEFRDNSCDASVPPEICGSGPFPVQ